MSHGGPVSRSVAHLWFLYVLLEFYAAILVLRGGVALMDRGGGIRAGVDRLVRLLMRGPLGAILMAAPVGAAFATNNKLIMLFCIPTPAVSFVTSAFVVKNSGTRSLSLAGPSRLPKALPIPSRFRRRKAS